jgi:hypothetical protein
VVAAVEAQKVLTGAHHLAVQAVAMVVVVAQVEFQPALCLQVAVEH